MNIENTYLINCFCICSQSAGMKYNSLLWCPFDKHRGTVEMANKKSLSSGMTSSTVLSPSFPIANTSYAPGLVSNVFSESYE